MKRPVVGMDGLRRPVPDEAWGRYSARPVRSLDELQMAAAIRAAVFMSEQACPYEEEYDGNDLCGTHFLLFDGGEPVGTLRVRWFADFAKLERIALLPRERGRIASPSPHASANPVRATAPRTDNGRRSCWDKGLESCLRVR